MRKEDSLITQLKQLRRYLLLSACIIMLLLSVLFYVWFKDRPPVPYVVLKPANEEQLQPPLTDERTNGEVLEAYKNYAYEQLLARLDDNQLVENGYTQRDLALAALVGFHHLNINKALGAQTSLKYKNVLLPSQITVQLYPGLSEEQYVSINQFVKTERWPLTAQGIFSKAQDPLRRTDTSLQDAFYLMPEYLSVETLFKRSDVPVEKKEIFDVLVEGDWKMLFEFAQKQQVSQDLTPPKRQRFLLDYIDKGSKSAAFLMLKTDHEFAVKRLDDKNVLAIMRLLPEKSPELESYAKEILSSPRSDAVLIVAAQTSGEDFEPKKKPEDVLKPPVAKSKAFEKSLPKQIVKFSPPPKAAVAKKPVVHIVQEGDSLWKISKKYSVNVDELRKYNHLQTDTLKLGMVVKIPQKPTK
jgi:LysM repeat protein